MFEACAFVHHHSWVLFTSNHSSSLTPIPPRDSLSAPNARTLDLLTPSALLASRLEKTIISTSLTSVIGLLLRPAHLMQ